MRARNLKPQFFLNEELATIDPLGRILFEGLWCMADRRGRLEDRPRRIKAGILPYDAVDVDKYLDALQSKKFILRYQVDEGRFIQICNFEKHQYPHVREPESTIPAPDKHCADMVPARLNPESPILNPESPTLNTNKVIETHSFRKPSADEVKGYGLSIGYKVDAQAFMDHYESNGWKVGKNPMRDWRAAVRNWRRMHSGFNNGTPAPYVPPPKPTESETEMSEADRQEALTILAKTKATLRPKVITQ